VRQEKDDWAVATPAIVSSPWPSEGSALAKSNASQSRGANTWLGAATVSNSQTDGSDGAPFENEFASIGWYDSLKSALAVVGIVAIVFKLVKVAG